MTTGGSEAARSATARRFVALPVPDEVRDRLEATLPQPDDPKLSGLRWARSEGWHLTLAFLGEVADDRVSAITDAVTDGVAPLDRVPEHLRLTETGRFGRKVLWLGVEERPAGSLSALAAAVRAAVGSLGLEVDSKPLHAHVTLARSGRRPVTASAVAACRIPDELSWQPPGVELWRSRLGDGPARYEVEATIPFEPGHR
jgi:RNA 2',3'-cyclic 3'-phosphodiesterase